MRSNATISVCTIVKNEASALPGYFESILGHVDEIVIVDTGSTDETINTVRKYQRKYPEIIQLVPYVFEGVFHYGKAKNYSIDQSSKEYILILDADERPQGTFFADLRICIAEQKLIVATIIRQDELVLHLVETHERIIKKDAQVLYGTDEDSRVHERLIHDKPVVAFSGRILHCQNENHWLRRPQRIFFQMSLEIERTPKTKSFIGHTLRGIWAFQFKFRKVYVSQEIYKDGILGFKFAFMRALYAFLVQLFVGLK